MDPYQNKWQDFMSRLSQRVDANVFNLWFKDAKLVRYHNGILNVEVPSEYYVMQYERRLSKILYPVLQEVFGEKVQLEYTYFVVSSDPTSAVTINKSLSDADKDTLPSKGPSPKPVKRGGIEYEGIHVDLNASYTFDNYCVGVSNMLVYNIAESVANKPGQTSFNPFFLYGHTGVGKTHLMQAIGHKILGNNPRARIVYVRASTFESQYINAVKDKKVNDFINFYTSVDVLLIDDIQELSGKPGTQNVFFPIFNHLHQRGTVIVMTSDRPPVDLEGLMDRLVNRFKWGVTEMLSGPDIELRKLILRHKSEQNGLALADDVIDVIARHVTDSVRELEGIVLSLIARAALMNQPITPQLASVVMQSTVRPARQKINFEMIVEAAASSFSLDPDVIFSRSRIKDIAEVRQVIMYLANKVGDLSSKKIGMKLSRSHVTVLHGIATVRDRITTEQDFAQKIGSIERQLQRM